MTFTQHTILSILISLCLGSFSSCGVDDGPDNFCTPMSHKIKSSEQDVVEFLTNLDSSRYRVSFNGNIDTLLFLGEPIVHDSIGFEVACLKTNVWYERVHKVLKTPNREDSIVIDLIQSKNGPTLFVLSKGYGLTTGSGFFSQNVFKDIELYDRTVFDCVQMNSDLPYQGYLTVSEAVYRSNSEYIFNNKLGPIAGYYHRKYGLVKLTYTNDPDNPKDYELMGE